MFDTETDVTVRSHDTAALIAEKGVRLETPGLVSGTRVYYLRPSQVEKLESHPDGRTTVYFFGGTYLDFYGLEVDEVARRLGWTS